MTKKNKNSLLPQAHPSPVEGQFSTSSKAHFSGSYHSTISVKYLTKIFPSPEINT